ncbi:hypothetical protein [Mesorhizobium sp. ISC11]|uniref:hypothetical protein n=1 Tax=Mesorhizobium sp. ISC11 TaxID=3076428 RepID=UPI00301CC76C
MATQKAHIDLDRVIWMSVDRNGVTDTPVYYGAVECNFGNIQRTIVMDIEVCGGRGEESEDAPHPNHSKQKS